MIYVKKIDRSLRINVDFFMVNKNIVNNAYPLHQIDDQLDAMRGALWFNFGTAMAGFVVVALFFRGTGKVGK